MCADIAVHPVTAEQMNTFDRVAFSAFGEHVSDRFSELYAGLCPPQHRLAAFLPDGRMVGTAASFDFGMTLPGGHVLPIPGVTAVGVQGTHRRRGILRRLMSAQLDEIAARDLPVSVLIASEGAIYRRFGYGPACFDRMVELRLPAATFREPVGADLELRLYDDADAAIDVIAPIYDRVRAGRPGMFGYTPAWWQATLGPIESYIGGGRLFAVVCEPGPEHGGGFAVYKVSHDDYGRITLDVRMVVADDPVVDARLWRYVVEHDLAVLARGLFVPVDSPLRWWLSDPQQLWTTAEHIRLHVRVLDVVAALAARRYGADGELVLAVTDAFRPGPGTDGTFVLSVAGGEGRCEPTDREPDLVLDIAALGSLYLAGVRATGLAQAQLITERTTGALARADAMFGWPVAPFCPTEF